MNSSSLTNFELSKAVDDSLRARKWSVTTCCNEFNAFYQNDINTGGVKKLNKDFVHRVRKNNFSVVGGRVELLCGFLKIDLEGSKVEVSRLKNEIEIVERVISKNPKIESKVKDLLRNIADIAGG